MRRKLLTGVSAGLMVLGTMPAWADSAVVSTNPPNWPSTAGAQALTQVPNGGLRVNVGDGSGHDVSSGNPFPVTPVGGSGNSGTAAAITATAIATGGTAVTVVTGPVHGCMINNPLTATGQSIATAEPLFLNFYGTATTTEGGGVFALQPGQPFTCPVGFTGNISANAATSSHTFSGVKW